ncbi:thiamine pyrophosphokinase 1-like [Saccoglossus kowalevskii]|uniref:Thiamine pyrophosphokinase n=1 Tax=Saccoglossus kowalevskii TaxID=10224 RepID=A0ABM0M9M0_SACKO|nr:PREDICTED: thiamin pyrophosphokinase 1-like [Saccoglossus kowalevskii]
MAERSEYKRTTWKPCSLSSRSNQEQDVRIALLVLNYTDLVWKKLEKLWNMAEVKACVDGGANQLYECAQKEAYKFIPDIIAGDMDSLKDKVKDFYIERGSVMVNTPDQNETDFTKCIRIIIENIKDQNLKVDCIVVVSAFGGRLDHTFANINTLYLASELTHLPVYLMGEENIAFLLQSGEHVIEVNDVNHHSWCGLLPVGRPCRSVTTCGLKWNLNKSEMEFGGLISTSNTLDPASNGIVTIETDDSLLWCMMFA